MTDKKKILVIDDEQFSLKTVQACMRGENYSLTLCLDPQEAYSKFKEEQYDVIITDITYAISISIGLCRIVIVWTIIVFVYQAITIIVIVETTIYNLE